MEFTKIILIVFIYGFWILFGFGIIGLFDKKPPKKKTLFNLFKTYWSEAFLIICMIFGAYFFVKGVGL